VAIKNSFPSHLTLDGLRVVLDCANGANYKVAPMALRELGAEVVSLGIDPDGLNINQDCGSLRPDVTAAKVRETRADIGLALDGDADRLIVTDENGEILNGDQILAICALDLMEKGKLPGNTLVSTVMSNMALEVFMNEHGGKLLRTPVGDRHVAEAMRASGVSLGGEQSGHLIFMDYGTTGDGLLAGLQLLRIMREKKKRISELAGLLKPFPQVLISVPVRSRTPFTELPEVVAETEAAEAALKDRGRVLLRYSGTEPLARIMVEGEKHQQVEELAGRIADSVRRVLG
jgi:phosphoglucosamine mutase